MLCQILAMTVKNVTNSISDVYFGLPRAEFLNEILEPTYFVSCKTLRAEFKRILGFWDMILSE
jgi:hypothetical protein